jgi:hypothetical protein
MIGVRIRSEAHMTPKQDDDDDRCPWYAQADAIELSSDDFESADAAELPEGLEHFDRQAQQDETFESEFEEWLEYLFAGEHVVLLGLEQSCHEGIPLPWDMRGVRLAGYPDEALSTLHFFWGHCPDHVAAHLMVLCYWVIRIERVRRTGRPNWSCRDPLPPAVEESAFFRPSKLIIRTQT